MSKVDKSIVSAICEFFTTQNQDWFCVCDSNFNILQINQSFTEYLCLDVDLLDNNLINLLDNKHLDINLFKYLESNPESGNESFIINIIDPINGTLTPILWDIKYDVCLQIFIISGKKTGIKIDNEVSFTENKLKLIADKLSDSLFIFDANWTTVYENEIAIQTFNHSQFNVNTNRLFACFPENTNKKFLDHFKRSFEDQIPLQFVEPSLLINKWFFLDIIPFDKKLYVVCKDISHNVFDQKINDLELKVFEMNLKRQTVEEIFNFLLTEIENLHPELFTCVSKIEQQKWFFITAPRLPKHYTDLLIKLKPGSFEDDFGLSVLTKKQTIVEDIETNKLWEKNKNIILSLGFKAWWSFPIVCNITNEVIAVFSIYCKTKRKPTEIELKTIARVANIIKIIIENFKHEDAISLSNNRYEMVTMATNDAIYDWDLVANKVFWSENIYNIFGYDVSEVNNTPNWWAINLHSEDKYDIINNLKNCLKEKKSGWYAEYRLKCKSGKYKYVYDRAYIIYDKKGSPQTIIGAIQDISVLKEREIEILNQNNKLKEIAQISSHELRRPVTSVLGLVNLFNKNDLTDEMNKTIIEYLEHATKELDQVIHTIVAKTLEANYSLELNNGNNNAIDL